MSRDGSGEAQKHGGAARTGGQSGETFDSSTLSERFSEIRHPAWGDPRLVTRRLPAVMAAPPAGCAPSSRPAPQGGLRAGAGRLPAPGPASATQPRASGRSTGSGSSPCYGKRKEWRRSVSKLGSTDLDTEVGQQACCSRPGRNAGHRREARTAHRKSAAGAAEAEGPGAQACSPGEPQKSPGGG